MKDRQFEEFDIKTIYQKLIAPSRPRTVKACDFFKQPDLLTPLQRKIKETVNQQSGLNR